MAVRSVCTFFCYECELVPWPTHSENVPLSTRIRQSRAWLPSQPRPRRRPPPRRPFLTPPMRPAPSRPQAPRDPCPPVARKAHGHHGRPSPRHACRAHLVGPVLLPRPFGLSRQVDESLGASLVAAAAVSAHPPCAVPTATVVWACRPSASRPCVSRPSASRGSPLSGNLYCMSGRGGSGGTVPRLSESSLRRGGDRLLLRLSRRCSSRRGSGRP